MARVVRPGGVVALFWDVRDAERSPLIMEYNDLLASFGVDPELFLEARIASDAAGPMLGAAPDFHSVERHDVAHEWHLTVDAFAELAFMPRFISALSAGRRDAFRRDLYPMLQRHADTTTREITIPYRTTAWIARRSVP